MASTNGETLSELERQAESTRAELAQTVDELHGRASPAAIKADVRRYARDTSQNMFQSLENRVRENPLQAVAVAAGLAYPLLRLAGKLPVPLLLIGAGVALSRRGGGQPSSFYHSPEDMERSEAEIHASGAMSSLKESASTLGNQVVEKVHDTMDTVRSFASEKAETMSHMLSRSQEAAEDTLQRAGETLSHSREGLVDVVERHPLLAGGIAFAVGSALASALPVTRQEDEMLGSTSDQVKRRARNLASQGLDRARTAAQGVYQTAAEQVKQEGLTPETARHTARAAMESVRDAVEQTAAGSSGRPAP